MSTGQTTTTHLQLGEVQGSKTLTVFSPPGICIETAKYPILKAGVLATTRPSEHLSIYDHPEAWGGLDREAILSMRRNLYRFVIPTDARALTPKSAIETLQTIALSVSPVAIGVEVPTLPPRHLKIIGGQLPSSPEVMVKSIELLSEPEISQVALNISQRDIPTSEAAWKLFDFDYSLEQVAQMIAVGLLGKHENRRLVPMKGALKVAINSFIDNAILKLSETVMSDSSRLQVSTLFGDSFIVLSQPGEAKVDYLKTEILNGEIKKGYSFETSRLPASDPKTSVYGDYARFSGYQSLLSDNESSHITVFHLTRNPRNSKIGPWVAKAGVKNALLTDPIYLDKIENTITLLESLLQPGLKFWAEGTPLLERFGKEDIASSQYQLSL
ncbi:MAG: hypothetical protein ACTSU3_01270 [Candidatus Thorarchaeota archaeon]